MLAEGKYRQNYVINFKKYFNYHIKILVSERKSILSNLMFETCPYLHKGFFFKKHTLKLMQIQKEFITRGSEWLHQTEQLQREFWLSNPEFILKFPTECTTGSYKRRNSHEFAFFYYFPLPFEFHRPKNSHALGAPRGLNTVKTLQRRDLYLSLLFSPYAEKRFKISDSFIVFVNTVHQNTEALKPVFFRMLQNEIQTKKDSVD